MDRKRLERLKELVDYVHENRDEIRYASLERFARLHNVSYETVKRDLALLAYALLPGPEGYNLKYVPKSYRREVRELWSLFGWKKDEKGRKRLDLSRPGFVDPQKAKEAASIFLLHTPVIDLERFAFLGPQTPEIRRIQKEFAKEIDRISWALQKMTVHPARAYLDAWRIAGVKLHEEIERALREAPPGKEAEAVRKVWEANLYRVRAAAEYEEFRSEYVNLFQRKHLVSQRKTPPLKVADDGSIIGQSLPVSLPSFMEARGVRAKTEEDADRVWQRIISDIKNLRRWYWPGRRNPLPRKLKKEVESWFYSMPREKRAEAIRSPDPFIRFLANSAVRLRTADRLYAKAKQIEEEEIRPLVPGYKRKRKR